MTLKSTKQGGWPDPVAVTSERTGDVVGLHTLAGTPSTMLLFGHEAKSRQGFGGRCPRLALDLGQTPANDHGVYTMTSSDHASHSLDSLALAILVQLAVLPVLIKRKDAEGPAWQGAVPGLHFFPGSI